MVRSRERAAESCTGLTVGHIGVGKEYTGLCGKTVGNLAGLTHKAVLHLHRVGDAATIRDNRVFADNTSSNIYRGILRAQDGTIREPCRTINLAVVLHNGIGNLLGIDNFHTITNCATLWLGEADFFVDKSQEGIFQLLVLKVLDHECSQLGIQVMEQDNIAVAHLVEYANLMTFAISGTLGSLHGGNIGDIAVITKGIVVDEITDLLYQAVVAHRNITQGGIVDARMFGKALGDLYLFLEFA